jgi:ubiquinol-cytochrome c reductase cytochrome c subunit
MKRFLVILATSAAISSVAPAILSPTFFVALAQNAANADNGKRLFFRNGCYECHGTMGQGGTGPRLAPRPLPAPALTAYIRKPGPGMPLYSEKVMTDAEAADVRAYLASIAEPPKDIPLLKP